MKQRLQRALERFDSLLSRSDHRLFIEVDVAATLPPEDVISRHIRVYWPDDDAWYLGTATSYDPNDATHRVAYADGVIENVVLALERVRLIVQAGETLSPAPAAALRAHADQLSARVSKDGLRAKALRCRAEELRRLADASPRSSVAGSHDDVSKHDADEKTTEEDVEPLRETSRVGDVVWAKVNGFPPLTTTR